MTTHYFHFTLGPVQGFVAQARRTRDFWAGSFLLSWLSAVAIKSVQEQGGKISFPKADKDYLAFLSVNEENKKEEKEKKSPPKQGSIPNRFKAKVDLDTFDPQQVPQAVQEAWRALADFIWLEDIKLLPNKNSETGKIWDRQISSFWDMSWIITDEFNNSSILDQRKNWRSYTAPNEPGIKCSMMDGWQELSAAGTPQVAEKFWKGLRDSKRTGIKSDLAENEALCAIAFVKRRFSRYFSEFEYPMSQGWILKGWEVPSAVPSVTYMAAVHWLESALDKANPTVLNNLEREALKLNAEYGEWQTDIKCIKQAKGKRSFKTQALDGNIFYPTILENPKLYKGQAQAQAQAQRVIKALKAINKSAKLDPVSPFYAILMMDGDSLGSKMSNTKNQDNITAGLKTFTKGVDPIVYQHNGFLIYAGGDDVLAILPLEDAIPCATALRQFYMNCFKDEKGKVLIDTTLSGAIEYVHIKTPLTKVLKDAHHLLDNIAKDKTGRDALAIRVWKPGGLQQEWAQPWEIALFDDPNQQGHYTTYLEKLIQDFQQADSEDEQFSSKFLYKIRERFSLLNPSKENETAEHVFEDIEQATSLMAMEYLNSGNTRLSHIKDNRLRMQQAKNIVHPLLIQCRPVKRDVEQPDNSQWERSTRVEADGALLVRFLANKGIER